MHLLVISTVALFGIATAATAQSADPRSVPREIGNRAHGFSYQPTPGEVRPREISTGVRPPVERQFATDHALRILDRNLLHEEGLGTESVPSFK